MKIAIIDSGVQAGHPHVGSVAGAVHFAGSDTADRLGHGTAVAGAIRERAPEAELFSLKVFDSRLSAEIAAIVRALEWCREQGMDVINVSLGTANPQHRTLLEAAVRGNGVVVSAAGMLPGDLAGVVKVQADANCARGRFRHRDGVFSASPYPRPVPGVPPEHNLQGVSFAVANMTGFVAVALAWASREELWDVLRTAAEPV